MDLEAYSTAMDAVVEKEVAGVQTDRVEPESPTPDKTREEQIDASLDKLMGNEPSSAPDKEPGKKKSGRDEKGRFVKKEPAEAKPGENPEGSDENHERAMAALKRDGLPEAVISQMSREELIEYGLKREKVQKDVDSYTQKYNELKSSKDSNTTTKPAGGEQSESGESDPITTAVSNISELFGDDVGEPFGNALKHLNQRIEEAVSSLERVQVDVVSDSMLNEWPQMKDPVRLNAVLETMKSVKGDSLRERFERAAKIEFAEEKYRDAQDALKRTHSIRDNGIPERPVGASVGSGAETPDTLRDAALDARMRGDTAGAKEIEAKLRLLGGSR